MTSLREAKDFLSSRYFRALDWMESNTRGSTVASHMAFKWHDAFRTSISVKGQSTQFEKNAVLFNIGAVLSQQARLLYDQDAGQGLPKGAKKLQASSDNTQKTNSRDDAPLPPIHTMHISPTHTHTHHHHTHTTPTPF